MSDQNPYSPPPPSGSAPSQDPSPYGGPPPQQQYPAYEPGHPGGGDQQPTSALAVVGFIVSLVGLIVPVALMGLILSLIGLAQTGRNKKKGRGFAVAGVIIGAFGTLVGILIAVLFGAIISDVVANLNEIDTDGDGQVSEQELEDFFSDEGNAPWWSTTAAGPVDIPADPAATVATA